MNPAFVKAILKFCTTKKLFSKKNEQNQFKPINFKRKLKQ